MYRKQKRWGLRLSLSMRTACNLGLMTSALALDRKNLKRHARLSVLGTRGLPIGLSDRHRHHDEVLHHYHHLIKTVCFSFDRYIRGSSVIRVSNDVLLERQLKTRKKTVRIVMAMTVAFFISWSPYALSSLIGSIMGRESVSPAYSMIPELMAKASVVYNPILYAFLNSRFRITLLNLCNCSTNRVGNASTESSDLSFPDSATGGVEMRRRGVPVHQ